MTRSAVILTPSYSRRSVVSQRELMLALGIGAVGAGVSFIGSAVCSGPSICLNRNRLMRRALRSGADLAIWIDDDTGATNPTEAAAEVLELVNLSSPEWPVLALNLPNRHSGTGTAIGADGPIPRRKPAPNSGECLRVGLGLAVTHLGWLCDHWPPGRPWFFEKQIFNANGEPWVVSEDYQFCDVVRGLGGRVGYRQTRHLRNGEDTEEGQNG